MKWFFIALTISLVAIVFYEARAEPRGQRSIIIDSRTIEITECMVNSFTDSEKEFYQNFSRSNNQPEYRKQAFRQLLDDNLEKCDSSAFQTLIDLREKMKEGNDRASFRYIHLTTKLLASLNLKMEARGYNILN